ncbi:MAG TPA: aldo/keto reductase [Micromonosporaceae bacterium]|nr:aldo/keto reductase [Micromonosporaceae bacterium]
MRRVPVGAALLTDLGLGCAPIGNLHRAIDEETATGTVRAAYDAGVRFFDTAPHYGLGLSERRIGAALAGLPRSSYAISTKVGRRLVPVDDPVGTDEANGFAVPADYRRVWDFSRDGIRRTLDTSLNRLRTDRIDVLLMHDPEECGPRAVDEGYPALAELRAAGAVRAIGVGSKRADVLARVVRRTDVDLVLLAGRYTLLEQGALDELLPLCEARGVLVLAAGVFNSGLLATDHPADGDTYEYVPAPAPILDRARRLAAICAEYGVPLPAAALQFVRAHPAVAGVVVGCDSPGQIASNVDSWTAPIPGALWTRLRTEGLLRGDAPLPVGTA